MRETALATVLGVLVVAGCDGGKPAAKEKDMTFEVQKTDAELREQLTDEQYEVTQQCGTEPPFTGKYWNTKTPGVYHCVVCDAPLFDSTSKFASGSGWPSFLKAVAEGSVVEREDRSGGMVRTEILCGRCGAHLGHVFPDGPPPTGLRFCVNSASLTLKAKEGG